MLALLYPRRGTTKLAHFLPKQCRDGFDRNLSVHKYAKALVSEVSWKLARVFHRFRQVASPYFVDVAYTLLSVGVPSLRTNERLTGKAAVMLSDDWTQIAKQRGRLFAVDTRNIEWKSSYNTDKAIWLRVNSYFLQTI